MRNVFVDGYNVINSWQELREVQTGSFENSRKKLIDILLNYATYNEYIVFLVFDGHLQAGNKEYREKVNKNLIVVFTKEGETADSFIEKYVNNIGRDKDVCVVTSDSLEQQVAFQRGAIRMSSLEFYHEVRKVEKEISEKAGKKADSKRYSLEDRIDKSIAEKLERMRRSK